MTNRGIIVPRGCPYCGHFLDDATGTQDKQTPEPRDLSVCIGCGGVLQYDDDLLPCVVTDVTWEAVPKDLREHIEKVVEAITFVKEQDPCPL